MADVIMRKKKDSEKSCQVQPGEKKTLATACFDVARKKTLTHTLKWSLCGKDSDKCDPKYCVRIDSHKSCQVQPGEKKTLATACIDVARKKTLTHPLKWSLCGKDSDKCEPKYSIRIDSDKNEQTIC